MVATAAASAESPIGVATTNSVDDPAVRVDSKSPTIIAPEAIADDSSERTQKKSFFGFYTSKRFWITLVIGQFLALCITSTNTFTTLLFQAGTSFPAFQTFINYCLLNLCYTSFTIYKEGFKGWLRIVWKDGWKYFILAFFDVEGNYFVVLAYRYTTILSAELINFWAIVVVVILSFFLLRVRYHWSQIVGILVCCAGMGVLIGSDKLQGGDFHSGADVLKGDLFMLLGATFYGFSNVTEEFFVSKTPLYVVIGQLGFWGMCINGVQAAIFDRTSIANAVWDGKVAGYLVGYNLVLFIFYTVTPVLFRLSSAAFFNISLLTANFWGLIIGIRVFGYKVHYLYPVAFVLIMVGLIVYYIMDASGIGDDSVKPWLGENQEGGHEGIGTAKRRMRTRVGRGVGAGADP
ncbi:hypothetical protein TWF569_001681 [Orbilia oligospora]|uniref:DUF914-domain-containing protein n=1 Tax=Orbilia oligospora TaxID=2813651 RepID=A0A7C8NI68_ORBOL|nr:hypothetical protein TWF706_001168 [Orbilia oligospora]KAF3122769.1 hypothetical protein TWF594_002740 [Orbilia oligospora]KAF3122817.1 hypothetical protein TWF703_001093 [Orbilia oligospora]KAF3123591.1 hypothetical protein TWF569_001681 [Orbilia oligospora]